MKPNLFICICLAGAMTAKSQIPVPPDPVCAFCGVDLKSEEPHKPGCRYYSPPQEEEEEAPKPSTKLEDYTPKQETKPTQTQQTPTTTTTTNSKPVHYPWMDTPEYKEYQNGKYYGDLYYSGRTRCQVIEVAGKGQGVWTTNYYNKEGRNVGPHWLYSPRYLRIYTAGWNRAVMQLKITEKWGVEDLRNVETVVDYEYDEIMTFNKGDGVIKLALNRKDPNGHNNWVFYDGENLLSLSDHEIEELVPLRSSKGYGAGVLARQSNGEWMIFNTETGEITATKLTDVKRMSIEDANRSTVMASVDINGKRQYGIFNGDGEQLFPFEYDNIMEKTGVSPYLVTYKNGKCGLIKRRTEYITNQYGNRTHVDKLTEFIEPRYDHFKQSNLLTTVLQQARQYYMVDNNGQYGFLYVDEKWDISTPTFYSPAEVEAFAQRLFDNTEKPRNLKINRISDLKGTGSYKDFCMDMTIACYNEAGSYNNDPEEAKTILSENNLKSRYLHLQEANHPQYILGKYDNARQAYPVQTHWGTVMLPVPPSEAKQVKKGWNSKKNDFYVKPWLDLDGNYETVINHISVLVNGKTYGYTQQSSRPKTPGCTTCNGSGRCGICNGRGAVSTVSHPIVCRTCNGSGKCKDCNGNGVILGF